MQALTQIAQTLRSDQAAVAPLSLNTDKLSQSNQLRSPQENKLQENTLKMGENRAGNIGSIDKTQVDQQNRPANNLEARVEKALQESLQNIDRKAALEETGRQIRKFVVNPLKVVNNVFSDIFFDGKLGLHIENIPDKLKKEKSENGFENIDKSNSKEIPKQTRSRSPEHLENEKIYNKLSEADKKVVFEKMQEKLSKNIGIPKDSIKLEGSLDEIRSRFMESGDAYAVLKSSAEKAKSADLSDPVHIQKKAMASKIFDSDWRESYKEFEEEKPFKEWLKDSDGLIEKKVSFGSVETRTIPNRDQLKSMEKSSSISKFDNLKVKQGDLSTKLTPNGQLNSLKIESGEFNLEKDFQKIQRDNSPVYSFKMDQSKRADLMKEIRAFKVKTN